ncbi:hypothetical protein [Glacieibacterium sp.]|uniref:hypothetical protein n=1 Tax=Glacieibacterium sp. TaxID=2860237 RepID=UPI003B007F52
MDEQQVEYLRMRETQERQAMTLAPDADTIELHRQMADRYGELAEQLHSQPRQTADAA